MTATGLPVELQHEIVVRQRALKVYESHLTGSRYICPDCCAEDSDWDVICLADALPLIGEPYSGAAPEMAFFESIKYVTSDGILNMIVTANPDFYKRFVVATRVAKWRNITIRSERVVLFQAILYGKNPL